MRCSPRPSKGPTRTQMRMRKRGLSSLLFMTFIEHGSRSEFGETGSKPASERKPLPRIPFCLLSHMFKRDNALLQGSWKQSCIVIGASIIWFLRKKINQPVWILERGTYALSEIRFSDVRTVQNGRTAFCSLFKGVLYVPLEDLWVFNSFILKTGWLMIVKHFITFFWKQLFSVCLCRVLPYCLFFIYGRMYGICFVV